MARFTPAYSHLIVRLAEVEMLNRLATSYERKDAVNHRKEINALARGAVVLLCSHVEAYIRELGEIALDSMYEKNISRSNLASRVYHHISKDLLDEVRSTHDPGRVADKIFEFIDSDLKYWSKSGPFPAPVPTDRFSRGFGSPAFNKIRKYFNRFGYDDYQRDLVVCLRANFQQTITMVDHLVDTRNKIAHGDLDASKTPSEIEDFVSITKSFCRSTDGVFATWWKKSFCAIR